MCNFFKILLYLSLLLLKWLSIPILEEFSTKQIFSQFTAFQSLHSRPNILPPWPITTFTNSSSSIRSNFGPQILSPISSPNNPILTVQNSATFSNLNNLPSSIHSPIQSPFHEPNPFPNPIYSSSAQPLIVNSISTLISKY